MESGTRHHLEDHAGNPAGKETIAANLGGVLGCRRPSDEVKIHLSAENSDRVGARVTPGASHGTVRALFAYGSSGWRVITPRHRPVHGLVVPSGRPSCAGALMVAQIFRNRSKSETSPRSAKYALRSPRSTAGLWLNAQMD